MIVVSPIVVRKATAAATAKTAAGSATASRTPVVNAASRKPTLSIALWVTLAAESSWGLRARAGSSADSAGT